MFFVIIAVLLCPTGMEEHCRMQLNSELGFVAWIGCREIVITMIASTCRRCAVCAVCAVCECIPRVNSSSVPL